MAKASGKYRFDARNPFAAEWAKKNAAWNITEMGLARPKRLGIPGSTAEETRAAIRALISESIATGIPPYEAAGRIRGMVGLNTPQGMAYDRYAARLKQDGLTEARQQVLKDRYKKKKIRQRANMIARTEIVGALNKGQVLAWKQAQKEGLLGPSAAKEWITTPDERLCAICEPMNGQVTLIRWDFEGASGPPAHPSCRCATGFADPMKLSKEQRELGVKQLRLDSSVSSYPRMPRSGYPKSGINDALGRKNLDRTADRFLVKG